MRYHLRPAGPDDRAALLAIYASTRADELALTGWPLDRCQAFAEMQFDAQAAHYARQWPQAQCQLIVLDDGRAAGRLWVHRGGDELHVLDISLLPEARGQGLGSSLLRGLMAEARQLGAAMTISVEIQNPARRLYERLGFTAQGEVQGIYQRMQWQPAAQRVSDPQECLP